VGETFRHAFVQFEPEEEQRPQLVRVGRSRSRRGIHPASPLANGLEARPPVRLGEQALQKIPAAGGVYQVRTPPAEPRGLAERLAGPRHGQLQREDLVEGAGIDGDHHGSPARSRLGARADGQVRSLPPTALVPSPTMI